MSGTMEVLTVRFVFVFVIVSAITASGESPNRLKIEPNVPQIIRSVGSNLALTCKPDVENPDLVTQLEWWTPKHTRIESTNLESDLYIQTLPREPGAVLIISKIRENMAGNYTCTAKYANTEEMETSIEVKTIVEIKWTNAPEEQFPKVGENYKIRCEVRANPAPTVEWIRNGVIVSTADRYVIENNGLLIKDVRESDDGSYICRAVVVATGEIQDRNIKVEVQIPPKIEPINVKEVIEGEQASIVCKSIGKPPPVYTWIKENTREDLSTTDRFTVKKNEGLLRINRVDFTDNSNYTCVAENQAGKDEISVQVKVLSPPRIYELLNITAPVETETKIICKATGRPAPFVTFRKLNDEKPFDIGMQKEDSRITLEQISNNDRGETFGILTISNLRRTDDGLYQCIAKNDIKEAFQNGHITVQFAPTFEKTKDFPPAWTWDNKPGNLSCIAESIPNATIEWRRQGFPISQNTTNMWIVGSGPQSFLIIDARNNKQFLGKYECIATNTLGKNSTYIELRQATVPGHVQQVKVDIITATTIKFDIVGPPNFHGLPLKYYLVQYRNEMERNWNTAQNYTWTADAPYILEGLIPQVTYNFRFAAVNDVGMGGWGGNLQRTMPQRSVPVEPKIQVPGFNPNESQDNQNILVHSSYADHFEFSWNVPNDNGDPIDSYLISYCVTEKINGEWRDDVEKCSKELTLSAHHTTYQLDSLEPDTVYKIELKAHNAIGSSTPAQVRVKTRRDRYYGRAASCSTLIRQLQAAVVFLLILR